MERFVTTPPLLRKDMKTHVEYVTCTAVDNYYRQAIMMSEAAMRTFVALGMTSPETVTRLLPHSITCVRVGQRTWFVGDGSP